MRLSTTLLSTAASLSLAACMMNTSHVREEKKEPTRKEKLEIYTTTATYLYDDGSLTRAQDQAVKALELDPGNKSMRRMIGWIRLRLGKSEDLLIAERFFRDLLREGDENEATILGLATTVERLGLGYDQARRRVESGEQRPAADYAALATANWTEAAKHYESTLTNGEGSTAAMNGLQRTYALLGRYEESLSWTDRLIERSTAELATWRRLLTGKDLTRREEKLYRDNERIARRLQVETHLFASTLLHSLGSVEGAIEHLNAVVVEDPDLPQAYSLRAQLLAKTGSYDLAISDIDRFLALSDAPFEEPSIRRAFELRGECQTALAQR